MSRLVYLPAGADLAARLRSGGAGGPWLAYLSSPRLRDLLGVVGRTAVSDDEAEYVALNAAGVAQLVDPRAADTRLVLAAEIDDAQLSDVDVAEPGAATVADLGWRQVTAYFADEPEAADAVARARRAARGLSVGEAWKTPEVAALLAAHDLLWYAPEELDRL